MNSWNVQDAAEVWLGISCTYSLEHCSTLRIELLLCMVLSMNVIYDVELAFNKHPYLGSLVNNIHNIIISLIHNI